MSTKSQYTNVFSKMGFSYISQINCERISFYNSMLNDITIKQKSYEIPQCSICLQDLAQNIVVLRCGHCYHEKCVSQSLEILERCPTCRVDNPFQDVYKLFYQAIPIYQNQSLAAEQGQSELIIQTLKKENKYLKGKNSILEHNMKTMHERIAERSRNISDMQSSLKDQEDQIKSLMSQITENIREEMIKDSLLEQRQTIINELKAQLQKMRKDLNKKTQQNKSVDEPRQQSQKIRLHSNPSEKIYAVKKGEIVAFGKPTDYNPKQKVPKINDNKPKKIFSKGQEGLGNVKSLENFWCNKEGVRTLSQAGTTYNTKRA